MRKTNMVFILFVIFIYFTPGICQDWTNCGSKEDDELIFIINSIETLKNNPTVITTFTLDAPKRITLIRTCHWNYGRGQPFANKGPIQIKNVDGSYDKSFSITYGETKDGVENVYWVASGNGGNNRCDGYASLGTDLKAGTYQVIDPDTNTWSYNSDTRGRGITFIYAEKKT